jgi:ATP-dependent helicase/nuclease subunit A
MPHPTHEQRTAITTQDRPLVVEAGAGTGKTWVLVARYLHLLESNKDWPIHAIVAITFTEKAAREMRNRIRRGVEENAFAKEKAGDDDAERWRTLRGELDRMQVSTVHSLCARILRENAIAAELDPRFDVLEEDEAQFFAQEAIRATVEELNSVDELNRGDDHPALSLFAELSVWDVQNTMASLLARRGTVAPLLEDLATPEALLARWSAARETMLADRWRLQSVTDPDWAAALDFLPGVPIVDPADKLVDTVRLAQTGCAHAARGELIDAVACFADINLSGGKAANWGGQDGKAELSAMLKALREPARIWRKDGLDQPLGPEDEQAAHLLHAWRGLWQLLAGHYDRLKDARHVLDFDDLERHALGLLRQEPRSARLAAYLDGIRHVMVDEFQDTNLIQQEIVRLLAPLDHPERHLFVVGDAKQSIYRFRQAQVAIFNATATDVEVRTGFAPEKLSQSFRTHTSLVAALNHLFDRTLLPLNGLRHQAYEAKPGPLTAARITPDHAPPPVELAIVPAEDAAGEGVNAEEARLWEAHLLADRLLALQAEGFPVWDKDANKGKGCARPFNFRDAAILFRATTSLHLYEEVFKQKGLPYLAVTGRGYYDRPEVQDLLALLAVLHNPGDDFNLAVVLRAPLFCLSDETLMRLRREDAAGQPCAAPRTLRAALAAPPPTVMTDAKQADAVRHAHAVLEELWARAGRIDVWQLLRLALDRTGYEIALAMSDRAGEGGGRQLSNVQKLMAMAREKGGANLSDFLRRVTDLRAAEAREGEAPGQEPESGAVQLMSIHASKGLEFPVVVVADLARGGSGGGSDMILHDPAIGLVCKVRNGDGDLVQPASYKWGQTQIGQMDDAESKRLLYVACTRAADLLILSGHAGKKSTGGWLGEILAAWGIDATGAADDVREDAAVASPHAAAPTPFWVKIHRATARPEQLRQAQAVPAPGPGLADVPPLSRPLPSQPAASGTTVTRFLRDAERSLPADDAALPPLRPAVHAPKAGAHIHPVPRYVIGNIVHRALADWELLTLSAGDVRAALADIARSLGVADAARVDDAVRRAARLIDTLTRAPIFATIQGATRRLHETPFSLTTPQGPLHGVLDLLMEDAAGWTLLDWKTEWVRPEEVDERALEFLPQLALYHVAAQRVLGLRPRTGVCLLAAGAAVHWFEPDVIDQWLAAHFAPA